MQDGDEIDAMLHQSKRAIGRNVPRYGFLIAVLTGDRNLLRRGSQQLEATKIQTIGNRNVCDFEFPFKNALQPLPARPLHLELPPTARCASYLHHTVKIRDPLLSEVETIHSLSSIGQGRVLPLTTREFLLPLQARVDRGQVPEPFCWLQRGARRCFCIADGCACFCFVVNRTMLCLIALVTILRRSDFIMPFCDLEWYALHQLNDGSQ